MIGYGDSYGEYTGEYAPASGYYSGYGGAFGDAAAPCDIKTVQTELNDLGFNAGVVDGFLGKNTYTALQMFALSSGTPYVWGQAPSQALCTALAAAVAQKHAPPPPPAPLPGPAPAPLPGPVPAAHKPLYINPAILGLGVKKPAGTAGWWAKQTTPMKLAIVGGAAVALLGVLYATGVIGGSKRAKANRRHARRNGGPRSPGYRPHKHEGYRTSRSGRYELRRDGKKVMRGTEQQIWRHLHGSHGYSIDHALKYEGYSMHPLATNNPRRGCSRQARCNYAGGKCHQGMQVQSLIFPKASFTQAQAKAWARSHGYRATKVDATGTSYRLRQKAPKAYHKGMFRTISMGPSIKAVVACPK